MQIFSFSQLLNKLIKKCIAFLIYVPFYIWFKRYNKASIRYLCSVLLKLATSNNRPYWGFMITFEWIRHGILTIITKLSNTKNFGASNKTKLVSLCLNFSIFFLNKYSNSILFKTKRSSYKKKLFWLLITIFILTSSTQWGVMTHFL